MSISARAQETRLLLEATIDLVSARQIGKLKATTILESAIHFANQNDEVWRYIGPETEILDAMIEDMD